MKSRGVRCMRVELFRLIVVKRNQDLDEKVAKLQNHLNTVSSQSGESHYFG